MTRRWRKARLELTGAVSGTLAFAGMTGTLVLDHASQFTGKVSGLFGDDDPSKSDILDLKDISFGAGTKVAYSARTSGEVTYRVGRADPYGRVQASWRLHPFDVQFVERRKPRHSHYRPAGGSIQFFLCEGLDAGANSPGDAFVLTGTAVAGPVQLMIPTDLARDQASLTAIISNRTTIMPKSKGRLASSSHHYRPRRSSWLPFAC